MNEKVLFKKLIREFSEIDFLQRILSPVAMVVDVLSQDEMYYPAVCEGWSLSRIIGIYHLKGESQRFFSLCGKDLKKTFPTHFRFASMLAVGDVLTNGPDKYYPYHGVDTLCIAGMIDSARKLAESVREDLENEEKEWLLEDYGISI